MVPQDYLFFGWPYYCLLIDPANPRNSLSGQPSLRVQATEQGLKANQLTGLEAMRRW